MKLVICLPDNMVKMCGWHKEGICELTDFEVNMLAEAIDNGKPLPKEHGRMIDADELLSKERPNGISDDVWEESHIYKMLTNAPTIIEADKTESEEENGRES
jgi:adenylate kinase family enzyme